MYKIFDTYQKNRQTMHINEFKKVVILRTLVNNHAKYWTTIGRLYL